MDFLSIYRLIRPYLKLAFKPRFITFSLLLLIGIGWLAITQFDIFKDIGINISSLPLKFYILWLVAFLLSCVFAFACTPEANELFSATEEAFSDLRNFKAEKLLNRNKFWFPSAQIKLGRLQASLYKGQGDLIRSYKKLEELRTLPLLPKESIDIQIDLMQLFFTSGNFKATRIILKQLQVNKLNANQTTRYCIKQAELLIYTNRVQEAKNILEKYYENTELTSSDKISILHTLAIAETHQHNYQGAITNYRQAWNIQRHKKNGFGQAEITISNLVLTYAKISKFDKITLLIKQLEELADTGCIEHILAINNINLHLARQVGDRSALLETYKEADEKILPNLNGEHRFAYIVNCLRMHWNDNVQFEEALKTTTDTVLKHPEINKLDYLRIINEIIGTIKQAITKFGTRSDLMTFYSWLVLEFKRLEPEIDNYLDHIPPNLPRPKAELLGFKINIIKHSTLYKKADKALFTDMFEGKRVTNTS